MNYKLGLLLNGENELFIFLHFQRSGAVPQPRQSSRQFLWPHCSHVNQIFEIQNSPLFRGLCG
jgi:hypothetical protein